MKNALLPFLLCLPFYLLAQGDDYCPCQETNQDFQDIFSYLEQENTSQSIVTSQEEANPFLTPIVPEEASTILFVQVEDDAIEEEEEVVDDKEAEEIDASISLSGNRAKSKIKKNRKKWENFL